MTKEKKKKERNIYNLFEQSRGFNRNSDEIPPIVRCTIEWMKANKGIN